MSSTLPKSIQAALSDSSSQAGTSLAPQTSASSTNIDPKEFVQKLLSLPDDFLRIPSNHGDTDTTVATIPRNVPGTTDPSQQDMLEISIVEAVLVKNYGLLRMDLYCKIRVGHMVCETQTCQNGAKNPKWDGVYQFGLRPGINYFNIEIYDEKQFSIDEKIAWLSEEIPEELYQGVTVERWFPLSGRLGPGREGSILLVLSLKRVPVTRAFPSTMDGLVHSQLPPSTVIIPSPLINTPGLVNTRTGQVIPVHVQANPTPTNITPAPMQVSSSPTADISQPDSSQPVVILDRDVDQLSEMFPSVEKSIIKAVLENNHGNLDSSITFLLTLG